jgi:hypothetical protein
MAGYIIYEGPSELDGKPIVVIFVEESKNKKTGNIAQTYILRSDIPPIEAAKTGEDRSICGDCMHRPVNNNSCYVTLHHGPRAVYAAYRRGSYNQKRPSDAGAGYIVRLGAYGDPAAVPPRIWSQLLISSAGYTGYSHQAHQDDRLQGLCQASADTEEQAKELQAKGWKTFRVKTEDQPLLPKEIMCLNTTLGKSCRDCMICDGKTVNVAINVHGAVGKINKFKHFQLQQVA